MSGWNLPPGCTNADIDRTAGVDDEEPADDYVPAPPTLNRPLLLNGAHRPTPGVNVDRIDVAAGLRELAACGWGDASMETRMVIEHALMRWARGEEAPAQRGAIDRQFHGIDVTSWLRVLAAARAAGEAKAKA
jgi:hypothetical protein